MLPDDRKESVYRYIFENQSATINNLAALLKVSHMTVRRDIKALEEQGLVVQVSGGAKLSSVIYHELPYQDKASLNHRMKKNLGLYAASLVKDGQVVYLDAGTTNFEIAKQLGERFNITVVTNDFTIANYLMNKKQIELFHTGGRIDKRNLSSVGSVAARVIESINIDIAFLSTSSWDLAHGISTPYEEKLVVKQAILSSSKKNILVSDSSKYGTYSFYSICKLEDFDMVITDSLIQDEIFFKLKEYGVNLQVVNNKTR